MNRWTSFRKAAALLAVAEGILSETQLEKLHGITPDELAEWRRLFDINGVHALRTTRIQVYGRDLRRIKESADEP